MEIRRSIIFLIVTIFLLAGCASTVTATLTPAEIQATQQAVVREEAYNQKLYDVKMALVWPKEIIKISIGFILIAFVVIAGNRVIKHILWERKVQLLGTIIDETSEPEQPKSKPQEAPEVRQIGVITGVAFDDEIEMAERELMNE